MKLKEILFIFLLILLAGLLYFSWLGAFSLYDADEAFYGVFVKEMLRSGDWLTLRFNQQVNFDKPPLYFWLSGLSSLIFGFNEFSLRFTGAAAGLLTVIATYFLGKKFYNQKVGFFSSIILATAIQFIVQSRMAAMDTLLTLFLTLTFLFFYLGYQSSKKSFYWLAYLFSALAILTKGPIGFILPAFCIFVFLLFKRDLKRIFEMQIIPGILILLAIAAPWYLAEWYLHGKTFLDFTLGFLFLSRFQGVVSGHPGPWYYYFITLILGFALWSHFLPYGIWRTFRNGKNTPELFMLSIILPVFMVFSLAKTKLPNYMLPIFPFLAIIVAKLWDDLLSFDQRPRTNDQRPLRSGMVISQTILILVVMLLIVGFVFLGNVNYPEQYQELIPNLSILGIVLIVGSLISIAFFFLRAYRFSLMAIPITTIVIVFILITQTLPLVENFKGAKPLGEKLAKTIAANQKIAAYKVGNRPSVVFYSHKPVLFLANEKELYPYLAHKKGYCWLIAPEYEKIKNKLPGKTRVFDKKGEMIILF